MSEQKIIQGDCLEVMRGFADKSFDLVLTDPPYEQDNHGGGTTDFAQRKLVKDRHIDFLSEGFNLSDFFVQAVRVCRIVNIIIFCSNKQISETMRIAEQYGFSVTLLIWKKPNAIPFGNGKYFSDTEYMVYVRGKNAPFKKGKSKVFEYNYPASREHPTQKPLDLIKDLVENHSHEDGIILDPFGGSGTTAVAAKQLNRNCTLIEISEKYCEIARKRLSQDMLF